MSSRTKKPPEKASRAKDAEASKALEGALDNVTDMMAGHVLVAIARSYATAYEEDPEGEETKRIAKGFLATARQIFSSKRSNVDRAVTVALGAGAMAFPGIFRKGKH